MRLPVDTRTAGGEPARAEPVTLRGVANAAGVCTLTSAAVPQGRRWLINYVTVTAAGAAVPAFDLYVDSAELPNLIDGTEDASAAVAPYVPPRVITQGQVLVGVFIGATVGALCTVRIEYDAELD